MSIDWIDRRLCALPPFPRGAVYLTVLTTLENNACVRKCSSYAFLQILMRVGIYFIKIHLPP